MIVIGVDAHKRSQMLVALDAQTGKLCGQRMVLANDAGAREALRFGQETDGERVWAIEDCRHVSGRFERALIAPGERVIRIPPALTSGARRAAREPGKSDPIDAAAVARALREGVESFPIAFLDAQAMDIRLLCDYRGQLISERVRLINRLRWHLLAIQPELETQLSPAALDGPGIRARLARQLRRLADSTQVRIAKAMLSRISEISRQERELEAELTAHVQRHSPQLLQERGCGTITAAILIGPPPALSDSPPKPRSLVTAEPNPSPPAPATPAATDYTAAARGSDGDVHLVGRPRTIQASRAIGAVARLEVIAKPLSLVRKSARNASIDQA